MNLIKKIKKIMEELSEQKRLEKEFEEENWNCYSFINYQKAKINYCDWISGKKLRTVEDYKKEKYGE